MNILEYDDFYPYTEEFSDVEDVEDVEDVNAQEIDETNADTRDVGE